MVFPRGDEHGGERNPPDQVVEDDHDPERPGNVTRQDGLDETDRAEDLAHETDENDRPVPERISRRRERSSPALLEGVQTILKTDFTQWIGRTQQDHAVFDESAAARHAATVGFDAGRAGAVMPLLSHWCAFTPNVDTTELSNDGHPKLGGFLPPVHLERRMWAGGTLTFHAPLHPTCSTACGYGQRRRILSEIISTTNASSISKRPF